MVKGNPFAPPPAPASCMQYGGRQANSATTAVTQGQGEQMRVRKASCSTCSLPDVSTGVSREMVGRAVCRAAGSGAKVPGREQRPSVEGHSARVGGGGF